MSKGCEHVFRPDGVVYKTSKHPNPGSDAYDREYFDAYVCERCLERRLQRLGRYGNTYRPVLFGARPARPGE